MEHVSCSSGRLGPRNPAQKAAAAADYATRNLIEQVAGQAFRAGLLTLQEEKVLCALAVGARPCRTGAFVNALDVKSMSHFIQRDRSTLSRIVARLEEKGWIVNRSRSNGSRGVSSGILAGIDLMPLVSRAAEVELEYRRQQQAEEELRDAKTLLRVAKGELRRFLNRLVRDGLAMAEEAGTLLASIPRRFDKLSTETAQNLEDGIRAFLTMAAGSDRGRAEMHHQQHDRAPPTDTKKEDSSCERSAGEKNQTTAAMGRARNGEASSQPGGAEFDIGLPEAMALVPERLRDDLVTYWGRDAQTLWQGLWEVARARWEQAGGDQQALRRVQQTLGERQGAVLVLCVTAQARAGRVRSLPRYLSGCVRKTLDGAFMWGAGARASAPLVAAEGLA